MGQSIMLRDLDTWEGSAWYVAMVHGLDGMGEIVANGYPVYDVQSNQYRGYKLFTYTYVGAKQQWIRLDDPRRKGEATVLSSGEDDPTSPSIFFPPIEKAGEYSLDFDMDMVASSGPCAVAISHLVSIPSADQNQNEEYDGEIRVWTLSGMVQGMGGRVEFKWLPLPVLSKSNLPTTAATTSAPSMKESLPLSKYSMFGRSVSISGGPVVAVGIPSVSAAVPGQFHVYAWTRSHPHQPSFGKEWKLLGRPMIIIGHLDGKFN